MTKTKLAPGINRAWFADRLTASGHSLRSLGERAGIDFTHISRMVSGQRRLHLPHARKLAAALGVSLTTLLEHAGIKAHAAPVPLVGLVDGAGRVTAEWEQTASDKVPGPGSLPDSALALLVEDGLMTGAVLYVGDVSTTAEGFAICGMADGSELACYVRRGARVTVLGWPGMSGERRSTGAPVWVRPVLWVKMA